MWDLGHLWSGSSGSPLYVVADGQIFENWLSHPPFSVERVETFLMIPKHGSACETSDPELTVAGADICYAVARHDTQQTFYGYGNVLEYSDLNPKLKIKGRLKIMEIQLRHVQALAKRA